MLLLKDLEKIYGIGLKINMYDFFYYILQAIEVIIFAKVIVRLDISKNRVRIAFGAIVLLAGATVYGFYPDKDIRMIVGMILLQTVGTILLFQVRVIEGIVKYMFASAYVCVATMPLDLIYKIFYKVSGIGLDDNILDMVLTVLSSIIFMLLSSCISKHKLLVAWIKEIPLMYFVLAYICGFATEGIEACIRYIEPMANNRIKVILIVLNFIVSMFLYAIGIGFAVANLWRKQYKNESILKDEYIKKTKDYYQSLTEHINEIRSIRHDMNAHLNILGQYASANEIDKVKRYLEEIREQAYNNNSVIVNVGNAIVSAVITDAMRKIDCKENMTLKCEGVLPERLLISDYDLCTIFSNLMSNSIEACRKLKDNDKQIHMKFINDRKSLSIICKNPIEWEIDERVLNGRYTSKKDKLRHGYGINNIRRVVECYDGEMNMSSDNGMFVTKIVFYKAVE